MEAQSYPGGESGTTVPERRAAVYRSDMRPAALLAVAWLSFSQPDYEGCARGEGPGDPRPLPLGEVECDDDLDCIGEPCEVGTCSAGQCRYGPVSDRDGDGAFPPPCGEDCDDEDRDERPGGGEVCNFVDDDCDGAIDEGARPLDVSFDVTMDPTPASALLPSIEGALVVHTMEGERQLYGQYIGPRGGIEPSTEIGFFDGGLLAGARGNDDIYAVVVFGGIPRHVLFEPSPLGFTITRSISPVPGLDLTMVSDLDVIPFGDSVAIAYDATTRNVRIGLDGADVLIGNVSLPNVAIATDGVNLAVLDPEEDVVVFLDAEGNVVARHAVPRTTTTRALASGDGRIHVATFGGSPFALTPVTASGGAAASIPLPSPGQPRLAWVDGLIVVASDTGVGVWNVFVIDPTTGERRPGAITLSEGHRLSAVQAVGGIAVSAGGAEVGFIQACGDLF
jgi:hypothetical protein